MPEPTTLHPLAEAPIWLATIHLAATAYMAGLCWFVHAVHYPLMLRVGTEGFPAYEREHLRRTGPVVGPGMLVEALSAAALAAWALRSGGITENALSLVGLALLVGVWLSTFCVMVPLHTRLTSGFDAALVRRLCRSNLPRTLAWSARVALAAWVMVRIS
jgi:hypothetical protein